MKKKTFILFFLLIVFFVISLRLGRYDISFSEILKILFFNNKKEIKDLVLLNIRMPRNIFAILAGSGLALSGFVYQNIFRNSLISPDILGVTSGASVGAIVYILFVGKSVIGLQGLSFISGIIVVLLSMILASIMKGPKIYSMIISGIIMGAISNSIIMAMKYLSDPNRELATIEYWLMGSLHLVKWKEVVYIVPVILFSFIVLNFIRYKLQVLNLGDDEAKSLGINVSRVRILAIIFSTVMVSSIVSMVGVISWIGLIVPHMVKMIFGENFKWNFFQSIILGGLLLLIADTISRTIFTSEIPISILTSFIGALTLVLFMIKERIF